MKILFTICFLLSGFLVAAQQDSLLLYPDGVPGALPRNIAEKWSVNPQDGVTVLTNVQQPALYVHLPEKPNGTSVIICPGGGYFVLAMDHEGHALARWFTARGITAFVLKYRLPDETLMTRKWIRPLQDVQQAFRILRSNPGKWNIDPNKIGLMGFSAGGHLAASAATQFTTQVGEITNPALSVRPDFLMLIYPVTSFNHDSALAGIKKRFFGDDPSKGLQEQFATDLQVTAQTPPCFLVLSDDDFLHPDNSIRFYQALHRKGVPAELHIFEKGGHGYSLSHKNRGHVEDWPRLLEGWLSERRNPIP